LRNFLRKEVTRIERCTANIICPGSPQGKRAARVGIPAIQRASSAPEHKHGTGDAPAGPAILRVVLVIERRRRPILSQIACTWAGSRSASI
jgi:hypothetical protein